MKLTRTVLADVLMLEPRVFGDDRGFFLESFNARRFSEATGLTPEFVQDNHSRSGRGVLRGLHYQWPQPQGKLVRAARGRILDVAVDLRQSSPTFARWVTVELSDENHRQLWIPHGFAHGFVVLSESADVVYKATAYYAPEYERCIRWDDPTLAIDWQLTQPPLVSARDAQGALFGSAVTIP
jgi:dTDP-4-dehydrorhamnose 3,5-epimerase